MIKGRVENSRFWNASKPALSGEGLGELYVNRGR